MGPSRWDAIAPSRDAAGRVVLPERAPLAFRARGDNRTHVVEEGDTLAGLAGRYLAPLPRACGYWWALAEFQQPPIPDPTAALTPGRTLVIPSAALVAQHLEGGR